MHSSMIRTAFGAGIFLASLVTGNPLQSLETRISQKGCGTHGPRNRACWKGKYSIDTDYEYVTPPTGKTRVFDLTITNHTDFAPDGVSKPAMLINGQFPGPTIEADWGDFVKINVHNQLTDNGTSIHWHGMHQRNTNDQDGANGITECPIPPGHSKTYSYQMIQYGTSWYHSHFSAQYGNGIVGAIQINGPASANYDIDLGPYSISDWYYDTADRLERRAELVANGPPPDSDNILFNGKNVNVQGGGQYQKTKLTPGKKHLLRLINTSVDNTFTVSLVGHSFTVIATDLVPVKPVKKDSLFMSVGQRYDVIIEADQKVGNYWFNATLGGGGLCGKSRNPFPASIFTYKGARDALPSNKGIPPAGASCADTVGFTPVLPRNAPASEFNPNKQILDVSLDQPVINGEKVFRWKVNGSSIDVHWDKPTLEFIAEGNYSWPHYTNVIDIPSANVWTWWVIENTGALPHPIHLHGHDFMLLGTGSGTFASSQGATNGTGPYSATSHQGLNFKNPIRRDVAQLPGGGWMVIAFKTDNPGAWLMHCHIAWHVSMGLSVQFLERKEEIARTLKLQDMQPNCEAWRRYYPTAYYPKHDSGL
ncbi:multicopper oxidase [Colletotrichum truncatum]|uniref:Multicopper oxidase n=1 Tax=Colletotrichum truncatum TaxID=5467 RepID=A0ACC3ZDT4_COLTU|nr:multicopper oxidase [Colletotrichum truncatum]KAF6794843.1 multicopper oxidase [Colletotrichum truncatum]